jgi:SET domain-containing protein
MVQPYLHILPSPDRGRGIFTSDFIAKGTILEVAPVILMTKADRIFLDKTLLHDYIFEWEEDAGTCCMALGYVPIYNHSYVSNCEYEMDFDAQIIKVKAIRDIEQGEELFINYNGTWNDEKPVWFEVK